MGEERRFFDGPRMDLSYELAFTFGGNVNHWQSVHQRLSALSVEIGKTLAVFKKKISKPN